MTAYLKSFNSRQQQSRQFYRTAHAMNTGAFKRLCRSAYPVRGRVESRVALREHCRVRRGAYACRRLAFGHPHPIAKGPTVVWSGCIALHARIIATLATPKRLSSIASTLAVRPWPHSDLDNVLAMSFCQTMLTNAICVRTWISPRPIAASSSSRLRSRISVSSRSSDRGTAVRRQPVARNMWDTAPPWLALTVKPPKYVHSSDS
jgi:hypothetical protein